MKKLLLLVVAVLTLSACGDEYYDCECDGDGLYMHALDIRAAPNDKTWEFVEDGFFHTVAEFPELDNFAFKYGHLTVYLVDHTNKGDVQIPLPYTRYYKDYDSNGQPYYWSQYIHYEFKVGEIHIYVTNSDYYYDEEPYPDLDLRGY